jgi:hypothetical protein
MLPQSPTPRRTNGSEFYLCDESRHILCCNDDVHMTSACSCNISSHEKRCLPMPSPSCMTRNFCNLTIIPFVFEVDSYTKREWKKGFMNTCHVKSMASPTSSSSAWGQVITMPVVINASEQLDLQPSYSKGEADS